LAAVGTDELESQITELAGHLNAAHYRWLTLIAEFDRRQGWAGAKIASCAHWLNFKCGLNLGAAREKVRVAHALPSLPKIAASMARGELSYSKVRALTRIACSATEDSLLMIALHGTAHHVETLVRHYRRAEHNEQLAREERQEQSAFFRYWYDEDGSLIFHGRMPALSGARFMKGLEAATEAVPATEPLSPVKHPFEWAEAETDPEEEDVDHALRTYGARRADALALMAGRKTRSIPPALRRALNARDSGCRFPGCTLHRFVDAHHVEHWADGGETKLSNLITLCRAHHRMVHTGEIVIEATAEGGWRFLNQAGRPYKGAYRADAPNYDWSALRAVHDAAKIPIDPDTAITRWAGERMDYDLALFALFGQRDRGSAKQAFPRKL
jgi:hypothetical protein